MTLVEQRHDWDCGLAAVATATGSTYEEVRDLFGQPREHGSGLTRWQVQELLWRLGWASVLKMKTDQTCYEQRQPWPPSPFCTHHVCNVVVGDSSHYVAWDGDRVYCPAGAGRPLKEYKTVRSVTGLVPMSSPDDSA